MCFAQQNTGYNFIKICGTSSSVEIQTNLVSLIIKLVIINFLYQVVQPEEMGQLPQACENVAVM